MAEFLAAVAIVSSIVQLVGFNAKIISRIDEFRHTAEKTPAGLKEISVQLPLLISDLKRTKKEAEDDELDDDTKRAVLAIVNNCQDHVQALDNILQIILPRSKDSSWNKAQKAVLSITKYDDKIQDISNKLRDNVFYLTYHIVVDVSHQSKMNASHPQETVSLLLSAIPARIKPSIMIPFKRDAKHFIGREDLMDRLLENFLELDRLALVGLGGVGKSQIAIEFAYRLAEREPDTWIFWVHVNTRARFKQSYADIARKVELPKIEHPEHDALQEVTDWLSQESNGKWLLVLDNCDDLEIIKNIDVGLTGSAAFGGIEEKPLIDYIPEAAHGKILATCRSREVALEMTDFEDEALVPVSPMSAEEALKLLRMKLPKDKSSDDDFRDLGEELGYIPLALKQAAAYISLGSSRMSVSKYLELFRKK